MEETVAKSLHGLNYSILSQNDCNLLEGRVAMASLALNCFKNEVLDDKFIVRHLESSVREAVTTIGREQLNSCPENFQEDEQCLFWIHISHIAEMLSNELSQYISHLKVFSVKCHQLIISYTQLMHQVELTNQIQTLHSCIIHCMSEQLTSFHCEHHIHDNNNIDVQQLMDTIRTLAICHVICHAHQMASSNIHSLNELMQDSFEKLLTNIPAQLFNVYQSYLETDKTNAKSDNGHMTFVGGVFKSVRFLVDSLTVLATVAKESEHNELQRVAMECALRLVNHCWEEVAMLAKLVPKDLPLTTLYVILGSLLWLHSQADKMSIKAVDFIQEEKWEDLLKSLADYCNGLRDDVVSYHCQLINSWLLQDGHSHDWSNTKPFFEGERCSFSVQMWHYHLCGLRHDLWTLLPAECLDIGVLIFVSVLSSSLAHLSRRYSSINPSYSRVNQFKADILTILYTTSDLLSSLPQPVTNMTVLTHRSCSLLLAILSVGVSSLEDIEWCLSRRKHGMKCGMSARSADPLRMTKQHTNWMTYLEPIHTSLFGSDPPNLKMGEGDSDLTGALLSLVRTPRPNWGSLLQVLLAQDASLALELCRWKGGDDIIPHMAYLLLHCSHAEWALYTVYNTLGGSNRHITDGNKSPCKKIESFVRDFVTKALQSTILSGVTSLHSNIHQALVTSSDHLEMALTTSIDGVESKLTSQLPPAVMGCLWCLAGVQTSSTHTSPHHDDDSRGDKLTKLLGLLLTPWIDITLTHIVSVPIATNYLIAYKHLLCGTTPDNAELKSFPQLTQLLCRPNLKQCISKLGSSLSMMSHDPKMMSHDHPSFVEHELIAEIISSEAKGRSALKAVHEALKMKWLDSNDIVLDKKFNPFKTWNSEACIRSTQETIEWKSLLDEFTLNYLNKEMLTQLLSSVRWEFQEGAESLLEDREKQLVATIQGHLCYHDNDYSV